MSMKNRASLPGADELFRVTSIDAGRGRGGAASRAEPEAAPAPGPAGGPPVKPLRGAGARTAKPAAAGRERAPSGRQRHDEKITFYCTAEELMDLEDARLRLRRDHGIAVDRGRLVREALAQVLSELEREGADASLVRRLSGACRGRRTDADR
jgi:hypothetical protein